MTARCNFLIEWLRDGTGRRYVLRVADRYAETVDVREFVSLESLRADFDGLVDAVGRLNPDERTEISRLRSDVLGWFTETFFES